MQLILYYAPVTCALVPYVTLTEAEAPFEVRPLNFGKAQHMGAEYLAVNPKHKVPTLVIDGEPLSENVAIQMWIARNFPAAKLLPSAPMQELRAISLLAWCASGLHPFIFRIFAPQRCCDLPGAEASVRRLAQEQLFENYRIAEQMLASRDFSSTISPRLMPTSSGVSDAGRNSIWSCRSSGIAWRTSSG